MSDGDNVIRSNFILIKLDYSRCVEGGGHGASYTYR